MALVFKEKLLWLPNHSLLAAEGEVVALPMMQEAEVEEGAILFMAGGDISRILIPGIKIKDKDGAEEGTEALAAFCDMALASHRQVKTVSRGYIPKFI
jgi:hypothetical protein